MFANGKYIQSNLVHQFYFFYQIAHPLVLRNAFTRYRVRRQFYKCANSYFHKCYFTLINLQAFSSYLDTSLLVASCITKCMVKLFKLVGPCMPDVSG